MVTEATWAMLELDSAGADERDEGVEPGVLGEELDGGGRLSVLLGGTLSLFVRFVEGGGAGTGWGSTHQAAGLRIDSLMSVVVRVGWWRTASDIGLVVVHMIYLFLSSGLGVGAVSPTQLWYHALDTGASLLRGRRPGRLRDGGGGRRGFWLGVGGKFPIRPEVVAGVGMGDIGDDSGGLLL